VQAALIQTTPSSRRAASSATMSRVWAASANLHDDAPGGGAAPPWSRQ
jgi:hypothetical protein